VCTCSAVQYGSVQVIKRNTEQECLVLVPGGYYSPGVTDWTLRVNRPYFSCSAASPASAAVISARATVNL
jgi:hypothetical protein